MHRRTGPAGAPARPHPQAHLSRSTRWIQNCSMSSSFMTGNSSMASDLTPSSRSSMTITSCSVDSASSRCGLASSSVRNVLLWKTPSCDARAAAGMRGAAARQQASPLERSEPLPHLNRAVVDLLERQGFIDSGLGQPLQLKHGKLSSADNRWVADPERNRGLHALVRSRLDVLHSPDHGRGDGQPPGEQQTCEHRWSRATLSSSGTTTVRSPPRLLGTLIANQA